MKNSLGELRWEKFLTSFRLKWGEQKEIKNKGVINEIRREIIRLKK